MSLLTMNVPFPKTIFGRLVLSFGLIILFIFLINYIPAVDKWLSGEPGVYCDESGSKSVCSPFDEALNGFMFPIWIIMLSGGTLILPYLIPVWLTLEIVYRIGRKYKPKPDPFPGKF